MTRLNDPSFIGFDGEPVTGRVPPRLFVYGEMSPKQRGMVAHAYKLFCDAKRVTVGGFLVQNRRLDDGTRVKMMALQGQDHVVVWPSGGPTRLSLPHGFAVVANWDRPRIFKRKTEPAVEWATDPVQVPQCKTDLEGENQVFRANSATSYFNHPMVLTEDPRSRWDYLKHAAPALASANPVVPLCTQAGADYSTNVVHYGIDNVIKNGAGADIYTMTLSPAILVVTPETPVHVPAATTAAGTEVILQHVRVALISPTFEIYRARFANERLARLDEATYSLTERNVVTKDFPLGVGGGGSSTFLPGIRILGSLEYEPTAPPLLYMMYGRVFGTGSHQWSDPPAGGLGPFRSYIWGFVDAPYELEVGTVYSGETEWRERTPSSPEVIDKLIALPEATQVFWPQVIADLDYPPEIFWRGGETRASILYPESVSPSYGEPVTWKKRVDTYYRIAAAPSVEVGLIWSALKVFEGESASLMDGRYYVIGKNVQRAIGILSSIEAAGVILPDYPGGFQVFPDPGTLAAFVASEDANNLKPSLVAKLNEYPYPASTVDEIQDSMTPLNTVDYALKSRHVIDFDHKGQFYAAIRVEVDAAGAEWQGTGAYWGDMELTATPTYTVRIYFETCWKGVVAETLLTTASGLRPPFEAAAVPKSNVMHAAFGAGPSPGDIVVHTAPNISPPIACYEQLKTIATHQGVNTHLVCADVRPDITGDAATKAQSTAGIEFSTVEDGKITPHTKYVTGQLYARTFKLSDFPDALWLLHSTKCDAKENDGLTGPDYFYMPALKTTIDTQDFRVEVRDGVHEAWSDDFMPGSSPPAFLSRDTKLYRV